MAECLNDCFSVAEVSGLRSIHPLFYIIMSKKVFVSGGYLALVVEDAKAFVGERGEAFGISIRRA